MSDLLDLTAELVSIGSESNRERALADHVEERLRAVADLEVVRVGDNVVARTTAGRAGRVLLVGHLDTVPAAGNAAPRREADVLWGLGAADMKSGLAAFLALAESLPDPAVDVTFVFYAREEIASSESGLLELERHEPDLLAGDAAILGEPTAGAVEAGCQGTMRVLVEQHGSRAHTARPWMGTNAIHRLAPVLAAVAGYEGRRPVLDGCEFREALQVVSIEGGGAGNVVPDRARLVVNHRFAPDRTPAEAAEHVRSVVGAVDRVEVVEAAAGAAPGLGHPLLAALVERNDLAVRAKLGWTDVARFAGWGVPAVNFGPGDSTLAHTPDERVELAPIVAVHAALAGLVATGA